MSKTIFRHAATGALTLAALLGGTALSAQDYQPTPDLKATEAILLDHITTLASDEYEGRKPGTDGGRMTVAYMIEALESYGFEPGWNGSFEQPVEFVTPGSVTPLLSAGGSALALDQLITMPGGTAFDDAQAIEIASVDEVSDAVNGKLVLLRDVSIAQAVFSALGSHEPAGIAVFAPEPVYSNIARNAEGGGRPQLAGGDTPGGAPAVLIVGPESQDAFVAALGEDMAQPLSLALEAGEGAGFTSSNVIAKLPGTDPSAGAVVMLGHWDHTGICGDEGDEDRICNGAADNASGIAAILETARRLSQGPRQQRDIYILGTTAEEMGLLGARYFAANPPVPLDQIHGALNVDMISIAPQPYLPLSIIGWERTPMDAPIKLVAAMLGRTIEVEDESELYIRRQDGWALTAAGVPAVLVSSSFGDDESFDAFMESRYHKPNDEVHPGLALSGMASDVPVYVVLMATIANPDRYSKPDGWEFGNDE